MLSRSFVIASLLAAASSSVVASPLSSSPSPLTPRDACDGNTATTRSEWCSYSIDTDYYNVVPDTGVTREYWLELTDVTIAPDGVCKSPKAQVQRRNGLTLPPSSTWHGY
jgi:hypothetical protein